LIYAKWELDTFDIQYVLNGGNNNLINPIKYTIESDKIIFVPPAKTGAKFIAWFGDKELIKEIKEIPKGSIGDTTIYAKWELDSFDIQYVLDGGENDPANPAKYTIESDKIVFVPPAKTGAKFIAWYEDKDLITEITEIPKGSLGDTIVYAKWELDTFEIQYVLDGGNNSPTNPAKFTIESNTIIFENPDKSKFIFDGWFTNANFTESINSIPKGSLGNKTVYARWLEIFKVNFIITTDSINPARDIDIVIDDNQNLHSDILGLADTLMADGSSLVYSIEINGIVIDNGFVTISGSDVTVKVEIVDCYLRWHDVLFCDNGKGLWTDFTWYKDNVKVSEEQFFHNPGGIQSGKYKLSATSVAGVEYIWEKDFKKIQFGNQDNNTTKFELNVFPVPVSRNKNLNISLSETINLQTCKIFIYGFNGTLIQTINNPLYMNEINIDSKFSSGLYQVILNDDKNKQRDVKVFVVN
jgi:uncharacterized repeat protein (TIGR02543 family)